MAEDKPASPPSTPSPVVPVRLGPERFEGLVAAAPDGVLVVDVAGRMLYANSKADQLFGYPPGALVGRGVEDLLPDQLRRAHLLHRQAYGVRPRSRPMGAALDLVGRRRDGSQFPVEISLSPLLTETGALVTAFVRDVSERNRVEAALKESQEALALVGERERIARDLHDTVIQRLFATAIGLQATLRLIDGPDVRARLEQAVDDLDDTIRAIRGAIFELREEPVSASGLRRAVLEVTAQAATILGFKPILRFEGPVDTLIAGPVAAQLLPTVREALANVARHARAHRVEVHLQAGAEIVLVVADDGVGVGSGPHRGDGLVNLTARAVSLGGQLSVGPNPGGGTLLEWRVPIGS